MHNADIKPYLFGKKLILIRSGSEHAYCFIQGCKREQLKELTGKPPATYGLARVRVAINNINNDNLDWIIV